MPKFGFILAALLTSLMATLIGLATYSEAQTVKISGFTNISLGSWNGTGDVSGENSLCVFNSATSNYRIRARGGGLGNAFVLTGTSTDVDYEVRFKESVGSYVSLTADSFQNFTGANTTNDDCSGVDNASLEVRVTDTELSTAESGSYSGTLTVLLETR